MDDSSGDELRQAMNTKSSPIRASSPAAFTRKRVRETSDTGSGNEDDHATSPVTSRLLATNKNILGAARRYGAKKKLRGDQMMELETFLNDVPSTREYKTFISLFALENKMNEVINSTTSRFTVTKDLEKNIKKYASAVLSSSRIAEYKGSTPLNLVLDILKKYRWDMPPDIEKNQADWDKLVTAVQYQLTQIRSKFKKEIAKSINNDKRKREENYKKHLTVYQLTQNIVKGMDIIVTVQLCARVATMRGVYLKHPGDNFWPEVDNKLRTIRNEAKGVPEKMFKAFNHILRKDKNKHGNDANFEIADRLVDEVQQEVDDLIEARPGGTTVYSGNITEALGATGNDDSGAVTFDATEAEALGSGVGVE